MLLRPEKWSSRRVKKIDIFKGVSPWFLTKNRPFSDMVFLAKKGRKKHFLIFWIENKPFWTSKVNFSQSRKKSTFLIGVSPWFFSKNRPCSHMFFLSKKRQKETFFHILDRNECFLDHKRKVAKNAKNSTFCKGVSPWFLSKNRPFSQSFLSKKSQKQTFFDILDSKEKFLDL